MQGLRLKPRGSALAVPLAACGATVLFSVVGAVTRMEPYVWPLASVPMLIAIAYMVLSRTPQTVTVAADLGRVQLDGYERRRLVLRPIEVVLKRWVMPVLGTRHGDVLVVRGATEDGREVAVSFGVAGGQSASADHAPCEQVDVSLGAPEFSTLSTALHVATAAQVERYESDATFALVPHRGAGHVFAQMLPWFGTMVLAGLLGVVGQPLLYSEIGRVVLFGATLAVVGGGLFYMFRSANRPKRETVLRVSRAAVSVGEPQAPVFHARAADLRHRFETYVYRTKYGTYRFPVLVLSGDTKELRIGVWEDHSTTGLPNGPDGPAPHYLLSKIELGQVLDRITSQSN